MVRRRGGGVSASSCVLLRRCIKVPAQLLYEAPRGHHRIGIGTNLHVCCCIRRAGPVRFAAVFESTTRGDRDVQLANACTFYDKKML